MSGALFAADRDYPTLTPSMSDAEKIKKLDAYLVELIELLRHDMRNLGLDNFNEAGVEDIGKLITSNVQVKIDGVNSRIDVIVGEIDGEGGIRAQIEDNAGNISLVSQKADRIDWIVSDGGSSSTFTLTSRMASLVTGAVNLDAYVTFSNLKDNDGTTQINGGNIMTNTLFVSDLYGETVTMYDRQKGAVAWMYLRPSDNQLGLDSFELDSSSVDIEALAGDVFLRSGAYSEKNGPFVQVHDERDNPYIQIAGGALVLGNDSYGPAGREPPYPVQGQIYFVEV